MTRETLDLRGLPVWERAALVLESFDRLEPGEQLAFLTEIEPRALAGRLEQLRPKTSAVEFLKRGDAQWEVRIRRTAAGGDASGLSGCLRRSSLFATLTDDELAVAVESAAEHAARKNQQIFAQNEPIDRMVVVREGVFAVVSGTQDRERIHEHLYASESYGVTELFDRGLAVARLISISKNSRYATIPFDVVRDLAHRNVEFTFALAACVAQRHRALADAIVEHLTQPILSRVAAALLPFAVPEQGMQAALPPLATMTQSQIAASAGTVKEVAARAISELERREALRRERGHVRYLDRVRLLEIIEGT